MTIIFRIDGGIGKNIAATAVCRAIKKQYPADRLVVITGYPAVFFGNPYVDKVAQAGKLHNFYLDNIEGQDVKLMLHNPYDETDFVMLRGHLTEVWCRMFGVSFQGVLPDLFVSTQEQKYHASRFGNFRKPLMVVQASGGGAQQALPYSWSRDLPASVAQEVVDHFAADYDILHIRRKDQPALANTTPLEADLRALMALVAVSSKRLFIDSFAQHAAAALSLPSVVCWVGTQPSQLGYEMHTNITANLPTLTPDLSKSVFCRYNIIGQPDTMPYLSAAEIFDAATIIHALSKL